MVTFKKTLSSFGVIIICFSAMFLETLFISYKLDMDKLDISAFTLPQKVFYDAQSSMCMMMNLISLGILGLFSFVLLFFSIARYIEENRSNMGILKAMGYSSSHIALGMMKFALPTFIGCLLGYLGALGFSERFYNTMNADHIIPDFLFSFNPLVFICIVIRPALLVLLFSYIVSLLKVKGNPLVLISQKENLKRGRIPKEANDFIKELKGTIL
ncbi:MAG: ABC transporter permease, partial [Crenarchaeota archaeon]|nr:ABC transporter permease [Thermoproteota archaeon]